MNEFNNRMSVQRQVLAYVNGRPASREQLCGLSEAAIARWASANALPADDEILRLLRAIGDKLSFLATKSQEQITAEYRILSGEVGRLTNELKNEMGSQSNAPEAPPRCSA